MTKSNIKLATDCKCHQCGNDAIAFWPMIDPDIESKPWCRKCLDIAKHDIIQRIINEDKSYDENSQTNQN